MLALDRWLGAERLGNAYCRFGGRCLVLYWSAKGGSLKNAKTGLIETSVQAGPHLASTIRAGRLGLGIVTCAELVALNMLSSHRFFPSSMLFHTMTASA
ncbi:hypothetical protein HYQ46_006171 [Verticillium longisporum]|nr:hypothetical protein HYQ46_006171 [Verticillium longisporum]